LFQRNKMLSISLLALLVENSSFRNEKDKVHIYIYIYIHRHLSPIFLLKNDTVFIWNYKMHVCCTTSLIRFFSTKVCLKYKQWFLLYVVLHCSITTLEAGFDILSCSYLSALSK
jgi:hypothetical protein